MLFKIIKWCVKSILVVIGILPFSMCSSGYREKNGKVTFNGKEITDKNFIILNDAFAKDSTTAYYKEKAFSYADVASFEAVDEHYAKDKNKVYYCDEYREGQNYYLTKKQTIKEIKNAHPSSFISLNHGYAKDKAYAFFEGKSFEVKDVSTFTSIDNNFSKDDIQAYLNCKAIKGSNGKTFELIDGNFAKDTSHIFYYGYTGGNQHNIAVLPCDKQSFQILDYRYSKDQVNVFFLGFTIKGADGSTFVLLESDYAKDKNAIYFQSTKLEGANITTFKVFNENELYGHDVVFAKDDSSVYMDDTKISGADVSSFKVLGENYAADNKHVYYKTKVVTGASPASFKVYPHDFGNADAEDTSHKYHEGKKLADDDN